MKIYIFSNPINIFRCIYYHFFIKKKKTAERCKTKTKNVFAKISNFMNLILLPHTEEKKEEEKDKDKERKKNDI